MHQGQVSYKNFLDGGLFSKKLDQHMGIIPNPAKLQNFPSKNFRDHFVSEKVNLWVQDIEQLAGIAIEEPQAAYTAFVKSISHRWVFLQRTIPGVAICFSH